MTLRLLWAPRAAKERDGLDTVTRARVLTAIERLAETGAGDVKALRGSPGLYRLRVGDWRVVFALDSARTDLVVERVAHRREVYRG